MSANDKIAATFHPYRDAEMTGRDEANCAWSDYRKDYGVSANDHTRMLEHKAFHAGWDAATEALKAQP